MATSRFEADGGGLHVAPDADDEEAAAIATVIRRYLAEEAAAEAADATEAEDPWARAARLEAVTGRREPAGRESAGNPWVVAGRLQRSRP